MPAALTSLTTDELWARAAAVRDDATGRRVTFSPKVFIPLTMLCRDRCGYCTFAQPPARVAAPFMDLADVLVLARRGAAAGCHEALFTLGEAPEERYPAARQWLDDHGYGSTTDYLVAACRAVLDETGLLPHANPGALPAEELARLREVSPSQGMMVETLRADLLAHRGAPDKTPPAGWPPSRPPVSWPSPTPPASSAASARTRPTASTPCEAIAAAHARHGHVQEVIVQNFLPKPGTAMRDHPPCPPEDHLRAIALARLILPPEVAVQAPPNLADDVAPLLAAGVSDWGGVSPVTIDHVNPERPWPHLDALREATAELGLALAPRLTVHPRFVADADRWIDPALHSAVARPRRCRGPGPRRPRGRVPQQGGRGRATSATAPRWCWSGAARRPGTRGPTWPRPSSSPGPPRPSAGRCGEVLDGVAAGEQVGHDEIVTLFSARGREVAAVAELADELRRERSATWSPTSATATSTTPTSAPSSAGSAGSRRAPGRSTCGARPTCSPSTTSPSGCARPGPSGPPRCASRAASTPASTATTTSTSPGR